MKIWHDDVRSPPEGWTWAKTNAEAMGLLTKNEVSEISLDHDLGANPEDGIYMAGHSPAGTGLDLVHWMIEKDLVPSKVTVHSWNPPGAEAMIAALKTAGHSPIRQPYEVGVR